MTDSTDKIPWEGQVTDASWAFGVRCRELRESYPYAADARLQPVLVQIMLHFVTELWDQGFSQTEIAVAFKIAVSDLPRYAAGQDRRGDEQMDKMP
jgi:hypothetical protein